MTPDELLAKLEPLRRQMERPAWLPVIAYGDGPPEATRFGGRPLVAAGEPPPRCRRCDRRMRLLFQLNLDEMPADFDHPHDGLIRVMICTADTCCEPWVEYLPKAAVTEGRAAGEVLPVDPMWATRHVVGWDEVTALPTGDDQRELFGVEFLEDSEGDDLEFVIRWPDGEIRGDFQDERLWEILEDYDGEGFLPPFDRLGVYPVWHDEPHWPDCPTCGRRMRHLMGVGAGSDDRPDLLAWGLGVLRLFQCVEHAGQIRCSRQM